MNDAKHFNDQPAMASCGIAIMAKASAPSQTKTRLVPVWYDVDDAEGLRRLRSEVRGARVAKRLTDTRELNLLAATAALIDRLWADGEFDRRGTEALRLAAGAA